MEQQTAERFEQWCIVEVFGHNVFAGYVTERTIGGAAFIQVDVPEVDERHPAFTTLFGSAAIYSITPTTEAHAREAASQIRVRPVTLYILPEPKRQLEARAERAMDSMSDEDIEGYRYADTQEGSRFDDDDDDDDDEEIAF